MGVAPLLEHLQHDVAAEVATRLEGARETARRSAAELDARLTQARATRVEAARREIARATEARRDAARQQANEITLVARQGFVTRVLDTAIAGSVGRSSDPTVAGWLSRNLETALSCLPPGPARVRTPPALAHVTRSVAQRIGRALEVQEDATLTPGIVVESADGALRVDATLRRLLTAERPRIAIWLLREAAAGGAA